MKKRSLFGCCAALAGLSAGCGAVDDAGAGGEIADDIGVAEQPIIDGVAVAANANPGVVVMYSRGRGCSGTLIKEYWVLTARHCVTVDGGSGPLLTNPGDVQVSRQVAPGPTPPADAIRAVALRELNTQSDIALVRLAQPIARPIGLWDGDHQLLQDLINVQAGSMIVMGYGLNEVDMPPGTWGILREGTVRLTSVSPNSVRFSSINGRITWLGDSGGPGLMFNAADDGVTRGVVSVHWDANPTEDWGLDVLVSGYRSWVRRTQHVPGDAQWDGYSDIALTGGAGWASIPVLRFEADGSVTVSNKNVTSFAGWAAEGGVKKVSGDFDGDGKSDLALTGGAGWTSLPVAFSNTSGAYLVTNTTVGSFPTWARTAGARAVPGDFNGDGYDDIALVGGSGWTDVKVAFSRGTGAFTARSVVLPNFPSWAKTSGAKPVPGDFNGDGRDDIALVGGSGWASIPIAYGRPDGTFFVANPSVGSFPGWSATANVKVVSADVNADGRDDLVATGASGWTSIRVAKSNGRGGFVAESWSIVGEPFAIWAGTSGVQVVSGDFNGDRRDDLALTGVNGWSTVPIASSTIASTFVAQNRSVPAEFPIWAGTAGVTALTGHKAF